MVLEDPTHIFKKRNLSVIVGNVNHIGYMQVTRYRLYTEHEKTQ